MRCRALNTISSINRQIRMGKWTLFTICTGTRRSSYNPWTRPLGQPLNLPEIRVKEATVTEIGGNNSRAKGPQRARLMLAFDE